MEPTFKINGTKYHFKQINLETYYALQEILADVKKGSEYEIVEAVTDCPATELKKLKYKDWLLVWEEAQVHITEINGTTDAIRPIIEHKGVKYGLPKVEDLTVGEFVDLDVILTSPGAEKKLAEIAAVVYRPIVKQKGENVELAPYDEKGYRERLELFQDLPIKAIKSANAFFLQSVNSSLRNTAEFLLNQPEMNLFSPEGQVLLQGFLQPEPGGEYSTHWLEKILSDFKKLRALRSEKHSTGWLGKKIKSINKISLIKRSKNIV